MKKRHKVKKYSTLFLGKEKDYFIQNLSMLVDAGMDIFAALDSIKQETRSPKMKKIIQALSDEIEGGYSLSKSLEAIGIMSNQTIALVRIGEESGRLAENLKIIALQEEKDRNFKSKIKSAMMYPLFVFMVTMFIGVGIAWLILPRLATMFDRLSTELPPITKAFIAISGFLSNHGSIAVPAFLLSLSFFVFIIFFFKPTKAIGQFILFHTPGIKNLLKEVELARMGYLLGTLINAGVPLVDSLDSLSKATQFRRYQRFYVKLKNEIEEGNSFEKSFKKIKKSRKLIPASMQGMILAGEKSGNLPETFRKIGDIFDSKTETTTKNLTVILEPILLVVVWLGVVMVALAVIMPIYGLLGSLGG